MDEIPSHDSAKFSLPVLAAFDGRPSHVVRLIMVQPLLAEHCKEGGKERDGETSEEDGLDLDNRARRAGPLGEGGNVAPKGGVVDLVNEEAKEGSSLVVRIRLELGIHLDDKCGGDCREQTSLYAPSVSAH